MLSAEQLKKMAFQLSASLDRATRMDMLIVFSGKNSSSVQADQLKIIVAQKLKIDPNDAEALIKEYLSKLSVYDQELYKEFFG